MQSCCVTRGSSWMRLQHLEDVYPFAQRHLGSASATNRPDPLTQCVVQMEHVDWGLLMKQEVHVCICIQIRPVASILPRLCHGEAPRP